MDAFMGFKGVFVPEKMIYSMYHDGVAYIKDEPKTLQRVYDGVLETYEIDSTITYYKNDEEGIVVWYEEYSDSTVVSGNGMILSNSKFREAIKYICDKGYVLYDRLYDKYYYVPAKSKQKIPLKVIDGHYFRSTPPFTPIECGEVKYIDNADYVFTPEKGVVKLIDVIGLDVLQLARVSKTPERVLMYDGKYYYKAPVVIKNKIALIRWDENKPYEEEVLMSVTVPGIVSATLDRILLEDGTTVYYGADSAVFNYPDAKVEVPWEDVDIVFYYGPGAV